MEDNYSILMASAILQHELVIGRHMSLPPESPSHPTPPRCHRAPALGSLRHTSNSHWLSISHLVMYIFAQSLGYVQLLATPWTAARQASLSITNSRSLLKLVSIESVMPSNHLVLCHPLLLPPSILPSIRVFSNGIYVSMLFSQIIPPSPSPTLPKSHFFMLVSPLLPRT